MIRIGASVSPALFTLLAPGPMDIDYIVVYGALSLDVLKRALAHKPVLLHDVSNTFWLNYTDPWQSASADVAKARTMLDLAQCPWFSTGIGASAEPQGHTFTYWRGAELGNRQRRETVIGNIVNHGRHLCDWAGVPVLLENFNFHPTNAYDYICEPDTFCSLIAAIGCDVLLDVAHARISAHNMGWADSRSYLECLPLERVREIHINHPGFRPDLPATQGQMLDLHAPMQSEDIGYLPWLIERCPHLEAITLEAVPPDEAALASDIALVREAVFGHAAGQASQGSPAGT